MSLVNPLFHLMVHLDPSLPLNRINNRSLTLKILCTFYRNYSNFAEIYETKYFNGEVVTCINLLRQLQFCAEKIGFMKIYDTGGKLLNSLEEQGHEEAKDEFFQEFSSLMSSIDNILTHEDIQPPIYVSASEAVNKLDYLFRKISNQEPINMNITSEIYAQLTYYIPLRKLLILIAQVTRYDYKSASNTILDIKNYLNRVPAANE